MVWAGGGVGAVGCLRVGVISDTRGWAVEDDLNMKPFWVDAGGHLRLAIIPRPRGGDWLADELKLIRQAGVDVLVSMLPCEEASELGLSEEGADCKQAGIDFRSFPITDRGTPGSYVAFSLLIDELRKELHAGKSVAVHCRASIGRASLLLASVLCADGWSPTEAFRMIQRRAACKFQIRQNRCAG